LVAAMANYLNFDIYDLELTDVRRNSELRKLLISTANRSILVVEDIDCSIELQNRLSAARAANPMMFNSSNQGPQVIKVYYFFIISDIFVYQSFLSIIPHFYNVYDTL